MVVHKDLEPELVNMMRYFKNFFFIFFIFFLKLNAQSNIVEYQFKESSYSDLFREFLIYDEEQSYYFDYVERDNLSIQEILKNYNISRGGQKSLRRLDNLDEIIRIKGYPNSGYKQFLIVDKKPKINWVIEKEIKKILGYSCFKATGDFRGRKYRVWFTEEIPVSLGPWKLDGLPGLILQAEDIERHFSYEAINIIQNGNQGIPNSVLDFINQYDKSQIKSYQDFIQKENAYLKDIQQKSIANIPKGSQIISTPYFRSLMREIYFEWEEEPKNP